MSQAVIPIRPAASPAAGSWLARHWFELFAAIYGLWVVLPWAAPVLMHAGFTGAGRAVYSIYMFFCHQLPERSYFLFGEQTTYSLAAIQAAWQDTANPFVLRTFIGNETMGWKVAWSDRMISFYSSVWLFALAWRWLRSRIRPLRWWAFLWLLVPLVIDGLSHAVSDLAGIGMGFRDTNAWLAQLTSNAMPAWFYGGDGLGSFNSWARLITGVMAGLGIAWFAFPQMERSFEQD